MTFAAPATPLRRSSAQTCPRPAPSATRRAGCNFAKSIHGKDLAEGNTQAPVCTSLPWRSHHQGRQRQIVAGVRQESGRRRLRPVPQQRQDDRRSSAFRVAAPTAITPAITAWPTPWAPQSPRAAHPATVPTTSFPRPIRSSTINSANLIKTCGQCHPGDNANFAKGKIHLDPEAVAKADFGTKVINWVRNALHPDDLLGHRLHVPA